MSFLRRVRALVMLCLIFPRELWNSSWSVLVAAFSRQSRANPAIIAYPLRVRSEPAIVALANMITLTPGTTTLSVSGDRSTLYIHALQAEDEEAIREGIAGSFERWLLELEGQWQT